MKTAEFTHALRAGQNLFGTLIVSPSPRWPGVVAGCGLDFVFIDTEHIALDRDKLSWMCQTYAALGLPPIVRIPSPDPYTACTVLDGGATGIIAPYVESPEQVEQLRAAVKLRPIKGQRIANFAAGQPFEPVLASYMQERNTSALIVNIESVPAMKALPEIVKVPDLDAVLIGPHDLTCSLGIPEQYDHPNFLAACKQIFTTARAAGIGAGIHFWGTPDQAAAFLAMGANLLMHSADISLFQKHLRLELSTIKQKVGADQKTGGDVVTI